MQPLIRFSASTTGARLEWGRLKLIKSSILASGTLAFREQIELMSEVIGQVVEVHVEESDPVRAGDLVITLDPKSYQAQVDQASALVRIIAFSQYRGEIEKELFEQEDTSAITDISEKIRNGFPDFALKFANSEVDIGHMETSHPFDAHPATIDRLAALSVTLTPETAKDMLTETADGVWFENVRNAVDVEKNQWDDYERQFREFHEQTLCYRYLPSTPREREIVLKHFPAVTFSSKDGDYVLDMDGLQGGKLSGEIPWSDVTNCELNEALLTISTSSLGAQKIKVSRMGKEQQNFLQALQHYYGRYLAAKEAQETAGTPEA